VSIIKTIGLAAAAFIALAAPALASTLTIGGGIATVTCTPSCAGIIGGTVISSPSLGVTGGTPGSLSGSAADLYSFIPSSPAANADALNVLAGTSFLTGIQTDTGGVSSIAFSTVAQWIAVKLGAGTFFLKNTSGPVTLLITYLQATGRPGAGGGISNYTEFGQIPVPGAIWLMGAGLAGIGFAASRKKKAAA
jgi:hypothetical protein